jgi:hypothetical protein
MSLSHRSLGCFDMKSRWISFGDALVWRESVVTPKRRIALGRIPALCKLGHCVAAARHLLGQQLDMYPGSAVRLAAGLVDRPDPSGEVNHAPVTFTGTAVPRSVVPRCGKPAAPRTGPARRTAVDASRRRRTSLRFPSEVDGCFF